MKLIIAVVQDQDAERTIKALNEAGHRVTRVASTGGFFSVGNTTLLSGVDDSKVESVIDILKQTCERRTRLIPAGPNSDEIAVVVHGHGRGSDLTKRLLRTGRIGIGRQGFAYR